MLTPLEPSAGPTGGAGVAFPASKASLITPTTFLALPPGLGGAMAITVRNLGVEERSGDCFFPRNWTETFALEDNLAERECESLELGCREEEVELQRVDREEDAIDSL